MAYIDVGITGLQLRGKLNNQLTTNINVKDYGAVGNGVTDDTTAFQDAIDYMAANGGQVIIPSGTYRIDSPISCLTFERNLDCVIIGIGSVLLDFSNMTDVDSAFELGCTPDAIYTAITVNIAKGDQTISSALVANRGDILEVLSTDLWGTTINIYRRELVKVKSCAAGVITLYNPMYDDYDKNTTTIGNLNSGRFIFQNIKMKGNTAVFQNGFTLRNFHDIDFRNNELIDFDNAGIDAYGIIGGFFANNDIYDTLRDGFGYGISLNVCQNIVIDNNNINGARHCIKMGLTTRSCVARNNQVYAGLDYDYPMDNHESCEQITFEGNFIYGGGMYIRGRNNNLLNNTIYVTKGGGAGIGICEYGYTGRPNQYLNIIGNKIIPSGGTNEYGIEIKFWTDNDVIERCIIADNQINVDNHAFFIHLDAGTETGNKIEKLILSNNIIITTGLNKGCLYFNEDIEYEDILVSGGRMESLNGGSGIVVAANTAGGNLNVNNVSIDVDSSPVSTATSDLINTFIRNCHLKCGGYLYLLASGHLILQNNAIEDAGSNGGIVVNNGTGTYTHSKNVSINCTGVPAVTCVTENDGGDY